MVLSNFKKPKNTASAQLYYASDADNNNLQSLNPGVLWKVFISQGYR